MHTEDADVVPRARLESLAVAPLARLESIR
jgi:hypothetical protein